LDSLSNTTNFVSLVANSNGIVHCEGNDGGLPCYACPVVTGDAMLHQFDYAVSHQILSMACHPFVDSLQRPLYSFCLCYGGSE
jgi:hypothetical protein